MQGDNMSSETTLERLRELLLEGAKSPRSEQPMDQEYFQELRDKVMSQEIKDKE